MVIKPNANIGLGINNPATRLEIKNTSVPQLGIRNVLLRLSNLHHDNIAALNEPTLLFDNGTIQSSTYSNYGWAMGAQVACSGYFRIGKYEGTPATQTEFFRINNNGSVLIGSNLNYANNSNYKLVVQGKVLCEELRIRLQSQGWPDYVFSKNYKLPSLYDTEDFINNNKHLPGMPSARELEANGGLEVSDILKKQQEKIEELTLYIIALKKEIDAIKESSLK